MTEQQATQASDGVDPISQDTNGYPIQTIMVIGTGLMGRGIALTAARTGYRVILYNRSKTSLGGGYDLIAEELERHVRKGKIPGGDKEAILERIVRSTHLDNAGRADFIIESVIEDLDTKRTLFSALDASRRPKTVIASNTSSLPISTLAEATRHPEWFIGMHFFSPVAIMKLVEVVPGTKTSEETIRRTEAVARAMGKETIRVKDVPGFLINRINAAFRAEVYQCLLEGVATMEDIDKAVRLGLNHPMGPFELTDQIGLEIGYHVFDTLYAAYKDPKFRPSTLLKKLVDDGELGKKTGKGWYDYTWGEKKPRRHVKGGTK